MSCTDTIVLPQRLDTFAVVSMGTALIYTCTFARVSRLARGGSTLASLNICFCPTTSTQHVHTSRLTGLPMTSTQHVHTSCLTGLPMISTQNVHTSRLTALPMTSTQNVHTSRLTALPMTSTQHVHTSRLTGLPMTSTQHVHTPRLTALPWPPQQGVFVKPCSALGTTVPTHCCHGANPLLPWYQHTVAMVPNVSDVGHRTARRAPPAGTAAEFFILLVSTSAYYEDSVQGMGTRRRHEGRETRHEGRETRHN